MVKEYRVTANDVTVEVKETTMLSCNLLAVAAGTNCPQGGDAGHGGRTYFMLRNDGGTDITVRVNGQVVAEGYHGDKVEIILGGDSEHQTFVEALEFALGTLKGEDVGRVMRKIEAWREDAYGTA
jgi:hypothetical protein